MNQQTQAVIKQDEKQVAFVPFGALDAIKLSVSIVKKLVAVPTKSGKVPDDAQCMKFVMLCQAQRLNPFAGDAFLIGYDGKDGPTFSLVTAHQAFLKRAEASAEFDGMESGVIVVTETSEIKEIQGDFYEAGQEVIGGWAKVYHKQRKIPTYRRLRIERFDKGFGEWAKDAAGMICKCAEADALRSTFPTMCGGLYMEAELNKAAIEINTAPASRNSLVREITDSGNETAETVSVEVGREVNEKPKTLTPNDELAAFVTAEKYTFDDFQKWAVGSGQVGASDWTGFGDLKQDDAKRILRAKTGLLNGLRSTGGEQ